MKNPVLSSVVFALLSSIAVGSLGAELVVEAIDYSERIIYRSPQTPGFTEWVSLWQLPDGRLRCSFLQLTGSNEKPLASFPLLESKDGGGTWVRVDASIPVDCEPAPSSGPGYWNASKVAPWYGLGIAALSDGTLVKPGWPRWGQPLKIDESGFIERSEDDGKTWGEKIFFLPIKEYQTWPTLIRPLRDGRLVLMAGCWKIGDNTCTPNGSWGNMTKMMFLSSDKGKTWSKPMVLMPTNEGSCEESDFCELPNGDLFWVHRAEHFPDHRTEISPFAARAGPNPPQSYYYSDRMQSIVRKEGETFIPGKCEPAALPHASRPVVIYTQEGVILQLSTTGIYWTADLGKTWTKLKISGTAYNPQGLQLKDGTIITMGHNGYDAPYGSVDSPISQQTFRLKVTRQSRAEVDARKQKEIELLGKEKEILGKEPSWDKPVFHEDLKTLMTHAKQVVSPKNDAPFAVVDGILCISAHAHTYAFLSLPLQRKVQGLVVKIRQGTDGGMSWGPGAALRFANGALVRAGTRFDKSLQADILGKQFVGSFDRPTDWVWLRIRWLKQRGVVEYSHDGKTFKQMWSFEHEGALNEQAAELFLGKVPYSGVVGDYSEIGDMGKCEIGSISMY